MNTINSLTQLDRIPIDMQLDGLRSLRQVQQADQIGLAELMRRQAHESAMDPMRIEEQSLRNRGLGLGNQRTEMDLESLGRKNKMEKDLFDVTKEAKYRELLKNASENELAQAEAELYSALQRMSDNPQAQSSLLRMVDLTKGAIEDRRKHQFRMDEIAAQGQNQKDVAAMRSAAAATAARLKAEMQNARDPKTIQEVVARAINESRNMPDGPEKDELLAWAQTFRRWVPTPVTQPQVDPNVVGGGILRDAPPQPLPLPSKSQAAPDVQIPQGAVDMLKKNPQLREAFDKKYGAGQAAKILGQ